MTLIHASTPDPPSPPATDSSARSDIQVFPEVLDALACTRPRVVTLAPTVPTDAREGSHWDIVEEWGLQSFPASDPPSNW